MRLKDNRNKYSLYGRSILDYCMLDLRKGQSSDQHSLRTVLNASSMRSPLVAALILSGSGAFGLRPSHMCTGGIGEIGPLLRAHVLIVTTEVQFASLLIPASLDHMPLQDKWNSD